MKSVLLTLCLATVSSPAAMILGFGAEVDYYTPSASGDFSYKSTQTHFFSDDTSAYQMGMYLEHPAPIIPNFRLDLTPESSFSGSNGIGGVNKVTFDQIDITPYYEILDNVMDVDLGITFKVLDGKVEGILNESFNEVIPMGYLGAALMVPGVPLTFFGSIKYVGYNGDTLSDARIKAIWDIAAGIQAQAGYRHESLNISDHFDIHTDVTFKGPFIGIGFTF